MNRGYVVSLHQKDDQMEQIERIRQMELRMNRVAKAVKKLSAMLDKYEAALAQYEGLQEDIAALKDYYGSDEWNRDFHDDEMGLLPPDLKRGVLSEDGIWNLLSDVNELNICLSKINKQETEGTR